MRIRDAREGDHPEIQAVTLAAYEEYRRTMAPGAWAGLEEAVRTALLARAGVEWIVAEVAREVVGSVALYPSAANAYQDVADLPTFPELRVLAVRPEMRGRGVGPALLEECVRRATATGASELGLHTSRSMARAIRLYEQRGFVRAPERDFQPEGAELVMAYRLPLR